MVEGPIRPNDRLADSTGRPWRVIETRPGGKVDLFNGRSRFVTMYQRDIRPTWTRLSE